MFQDYSLEVVEFPSSWKKEKLVSLSLGACDYRTPCVGRLQMRTLRPARFSLTRRRHRPPDHPP
jgi:hypothetical protein